MQIPSLEGMVVAFSVFSFFFSWFRQGVNLENLPSAAFKGAAAGNLPIGLVILAVAAGTLDRSYLNEILSQNWVLYYAGALLSGCGILALKNKG